MGTHQHAGIHTNVDTHKGDRYTVKLVLTPRLCTKLLSPVTDGTDNVDEVDENPLKAQTEYDESGEGGHEHAEIIYCLSFYKKIKN